MIVLTIVFASLICIDNSDDRITELIKQAASPKGSQRIAALTELGKLFPSLESEDRQRVAETIIRAVADQYHLVVSAAKMQMAEQPETFNEYLGPFLKSDKPYIFNQGCEAIKAIGPPARKWIRDLAKKLETDDRNFQLGSLHALAVLDKQDLLPLLDQVIPKLDSKDFNVQLSACRVIAKIGPEANKAGPKLIEVLENGVASARSWASIALGAIGPHKEYDVVALLAERLDRFYLVDRQRALIGLAYLEGQAKDALPKVEELMRMQNKSVQHTASRTYWKITGDSKKAIETMIPLLDRLELSIETMDILGEMGHEAKSAVPHLIKQLKAAEPAYREAAIYALANIGANAKEAVEPLEKMKNDEDLLIREAAQMAIRKILAPTTEPGVSDQSANDGK